MKKKVQSSLRSLKWKQQWKATVVCLVIIGVLVGALWIGGSYYFHLSPSDFVKQAGRVVATPVLAKLYNEDEHAAAILRERYLIGEHQLSVSSSVESWKCIESQLPGFHFLGAGNDAETSTDIPFIYESINAPYLVEFREYYQLDELIANAVNEYEAMLRLGAWVGTRWDHGIDPVPGGITVPDPIAIIQAGENGLKFWCEVAAKVTVNAATALGWPARLVTASTDGYTWEHAVAELWSNQYAKWFVMDTDFNVVYESKGIPLSAFELSHDGLKLQKTNQLDTRLIAPAKPSLPLIDLLPFYRYTHIDLRNDWYSRRLRRGSPAGGDLATWWTSRPSLGNILTAKIRVDDQSKFDWPVNSVGIYAISVDSASDSSHLLHVGLSGYSPVFKSFQFSLDGEPWQETVSGQYSFRLSPGQHVIQTRIITMTNQLGPIYTVQFEMS